MTNPNKYYDEMDDVKEFTKSENGCLRKILGFIVIVLSAALILWLTSCTPKLHKPKHSYEKIQTTIPNRG